MFRIFIVSYVVMILVIEVGMNVWLVFCVINLLLFLFRINMIFEGVVVVILFFRLV